MERQRQSSVPYNIGSMEHATPRVVSMVKYSAFSGRAEGVNLKQDIMSTLNFINNERNAWQKMQLASIMLAKSMSRASLGDVAKLSHRWQEVSVLCQIQRVKRESLKYNTELQRTFQHGTVDNQNIKRKIVRPEHFERGTPHSLKTTKLNDKSHVSKRTTKPIVNQVRNVTSPWEGSQFKYELLCSLRAKLIKKLVLAAFKCYKQMQLSCRQCIATCHRSKFRRLMQLCFSALLLEALSTKYIVFAANVNTRKLVTRKYLLPSLHLLQRFAHKVQHNTMLYQRGEAQYRKSKRRAGYKLLLWHAQYLQRSRVYTKWAAQRTAKQTILKAFSAWMGSFIEKNKLRQQIYERYSHSHIHHDGIQNTTSIHSPSGSAVTHATRSTDTPLKRVLTQSPLQNLRTAVSFFIDHHTKNKDTLLQQSTRFTVNTRDSPGVKEAVSSSSEDENTPICDLNLSKSYQKILHTHSKAALNDLQTALHRNNHSLHVDSLSDGSFSLDTTSSTPTTAPLLHNNMRNAFRSCLRAKKLFPQSRFDNSAFDTTINDITTNTPYNVNKSTLGTISSGISSSSIDSGDNKSSNTRHTINTSAKWRNRFADKDGYISATSEHVLSSDSNSIEDLLLNQTTSFTPSSHRANSASAHGISNMNTTARNATLYRHDSSMHSGGLMDRAIHESFILSPQKPSSIPSVSSIQDSATTSYHTTSNANNNTKHSTTYFNRVTTTGTFCAEVEVDSDIETQLAESFKHSADAINNSIYIKGRYQGVDEAARRLAVQRRFLTQIQGAFQMIKFQWLIRSCRRFVRTLHRQARLRKASYLCTKLHNKHTRSRALRVWSKLYDKHSVYNTLCSRIYTTKLCKRLLLAWHSASIKRLIPAYTHTFTLSLGNQKRRSFHLWRALYVQRRYQNNANNVLARGKKVRIFANWRVYVAMMKQSKHIHSVMRSRTLMPVFKQWRNKYKQRLLLSRVFTIHEAAWDYRQYTVPSPFQRLYAVVTAWKQYTGQKLRIRRQESNQRRALFFRGVTLLATHYHRWVDAVCSARRDRRQRAVHHRELTTRCFRVWAEQTKHLQQQLCTLQHTILVTSPLRRVLHRWHQHVQRKCKTAPFAHYLRSVVQKVFDCLKTLRPLRLMEERKVHACETSRMRISLRSWHGLFVRTQRYRRGLSMLASAFYTLKRNLAYYTWPGRRESLLVRQMQEYFAHKHKNRIMLVEHDPSAQGKGSAEHKAEVASFLSKKRPTFAYRATKHKIVENLADVAGLHYYRTLCTTILEMWSASVKRDISIRYRALMVRQALQSRQVRKYMMQWVLVTPKTSYRRVVWMLKSAHKPHDAYEHKKEQDWVYNHAVKQRTNTLKNNKSSKKHAATGLSKAGNGGASQLTMNKSDANAMDRAITGEVSTQPNAPASAPVRYKILDCNNQIIDVCEGEYYTDSDDSHCGDSVDHHQVVWR